MNEIPQIRTINVSELHYDPVNPRLPKELHGASDEELATYYYEESSVYELAESMLTNGFFPQEPLIVIEEAKGGYVVVEGNRRLTALRLLLGYESTESLPKPIDADTGDAKKLLGSVPCAVVKNRASITEYLGFRHIGGQKTWRPEAKARFIVDFVRNIADGTSTQPFRDVAKKIGSNTQGIRNPFVAYSILDAARSEFGINVNFVERERFGVWNRLSTVPEIREYIGFAGGKTLPEIEESLSGLDQDKLAEVIADLTPGKGTTKAILADSRDANLYGLVLLNQQARETLRETKDLETAAILVSDAHLAIRVDGIKAKVDALLKDLRSTIVTDEVVQSAEGLAISARTFYATAKELSQPLD